MLSKFSLKMKPINFFIGWILLSQMATAQPVKNYDLHFDSLAKRWDEAIPIGNGWLGALIWQKGNNLRISLDRVDIWDDRPMPEIDKLTFKWVQEKIKLNQYDAVQKTGDEPYETNAAPSKIPGAAIEFDLTKLGRVISNDLNIATGLSVIRFENGTSFNNYIHAVEQVGYFSFENIKEEVLPDLIPPFYFSGSTGSNGNSTEGKGLERLGYKKGSIIKTANSIRYHQPTWSGNYYEVLIRWQSISKNHIIGQWTISNNQTAKLPLLNKRSVEPTHWPSHARWWKDFWSRSAISLPDKLLERQYYLDMYKFACVARSNTPPISLQAIWTADNGNLPPWKGDLHHDLNTELSYWPGYTGNHLDLTVSFTNWLWKVKQENKRWTKQYFGIDGLNVPGVTTISGKPMGGWIQYAMSPTTVTWLVQHFYWQWKFSMDKKFLKERCVPYFDEAEKFLFKLRKYNPVNGKYSIPLSSSPEYHDNSIRAWFTDLTNYDLGLIRNFYSMYVSALSSLPPRNYKMFFLDSQLYPEYATNKTGLTIAPGENLDESHRHHAHLISIYPLGNINKENDKEKEIINRSLRWLEKKGTRQWVGYSFGWAAGIYARAGEADSAVSMLQKFASNFCSVNSFHLNGDQKGGQYSDFTYRPFTLEGNFAFAQGVHELLLQSHKGFIEVFPSVPEIWKDISFTTLRAEGAFLISAKKENGKVTFIKITAEKGGLMDIKLPFSSWIVEGINRKLIRTDNEITSVLLKKRQTIIIKRIAE